MRRTGLAAMVTVYAARSVSEKMIEGVGRMHSRINGVTADGVAYRADDPELLRWVHATALFGFMEAYHRFVQPLSGEERDRLVSEGVTAAELYGAVNPPRSEAEMKGLFDEMRPKLEASDIIQEFLSIMAGLSLFPRMLRPINGALLRSAVDLVPDEMAGSLGLSKGTSSSALDRTVVRRLAREVEQWPLASMPAALAGRRVGN